MTSLRAELRQRRLDMGLTTRELVHRVKVAYPAVRGFHTSAICEWESTSSPRSPSIEQLVIWAEVLGWSIELKPIRRARAA
jgi:transcriptional regulator with XRE-family HTH domain